MRRGARSVPLVCSTRADSRHGPRDRHRVRAREDPDRVRERHHSRHEARSFLWYLALCIVSDRLLCFDLDDTIVRFSAGQPDFWVSALAQELDEGHDAAVLRRAIDPVSDALWSDPVRAFHGRLHMHEARREIALTALAALGVARDCCLRIADHVTDKQPLNFEAVGLILRLFPHAVVICLRRDPIETGLSVYRQEFNKPWTFAHRLEDIGHAYRRHERLVAHWEKIFPDRILIVRYEDFASDFLQAAPRLVRACGLDWEQGCLEFQRLPNPFSTFSTVQVRDPVANLNGRAARYAPYLGPLVDSLTPHNRPTRT